MSLPIAVLRGHTVQPRSEWDRQTDGRTADGSQHCFMPLNRRAGHNKQSA